MRRIGLAVILAVRFVLVPLWQRCWLRDIAAKVGGTGIALSPNVKTHARRVVAFIYYAALPRRSACH